jgi:aminoglycoside phosphotransferase
LKIYGIVGVGIAWLVAQTIVAVVVYMTQLRGLWSNAQRDNQATPRVSTNPRWLTVAVPILYRIASRLGLLSLLKDLQRKWSVRQRRARIENLLPELFKALPADVYNPAEDQWKVRHVAHTVTNTTVAFLGSMDEPPPIVLKLPGSDKDAESQKKQYETLESLYKDKRLDGWSRMLPEVVVSGKVGEQVFYAEHTLPGVPLLQFLKDAETSQQVINLAANKIGLLHQHTAHSILVDKDLLQTWVHEPVHNIRRLASDGTIKSTHLKTIERMAVQLHKALAGRNISASWVHGDYCPSNILVDPAGSEITGIVDWDMARPDDIPLLDLIHLFISVRMDMQQLEMGHIVRGLLMDEDWTPEELQLIEAAQNNLPGNPVDLHSLLILSWLRHINSNLIKTSRFDHHNVWINENVVPVLEALNNWSAVKKKNLGLTNEMKTSEKTLINPSYFLARPRATLANAISSSGTSLLMLAGVILLWIISLPKVDLSRMNDLGLISVLPASFLIALAILAISFLLALRKKNPNEYILLLHILVLIIILHGTPQILYGTVRYSWAWKHVGIVDYIQRHGSVNPKIHNLNAYHNWPGFFALAAFYNGVAGLQSSIIYAGWAPVFFNILVLGALLMVFKTFTNDRRLIWLSVWFFYLSSWVGQDYFSPQAMTYFLYFVVIAIVLTWFKRYKDPLQVYAKQRIQGSWISKLYDAIVSRSLQENVTNTRIDARQRTVMMISLILILIAIASSHQLTPLMTISALSLLVLFQMISPRYLPVLMVVFTVGWVLFLAVGFLEGNLYWVVTSFGALFHNFNANLIDLKVASPGQQFIALMDRSLSTLIWVLGILGFVRRYRAGHWDLPAILLAVTPLPMLVLNSYGGEMLFRVYLFSLPFVAFFAASLVYPKQSTRHSLLTTVVASLLSFFLLTGFLFAYYGKERMYYFTKNEVAAAEFVYNNAPKGSLLADGTWDWPRQSTNYEFYNYFSIASLPEKEMLRILDDPDVILSQLMENVAPESVFTISAIPSGQQDSLLVTKGMSKEKYPAAYFIVTRSQLAESQMTGMLKTDWLARIINDLMKSDHFKVVFANPDAIVFQIVQVEGK